ncbi:MAG: hypothetical protein WC699_03965 [Bacteroidales bacterium]|jgi:hypothetical protein
MESLTRHNYEIWFLDYLDGQLSNEQLETFLDFLEQNPDLKAELQGVGGVSLLSAGESFDRKESLLKSSEDIPGIASIDQLCIARMENDLSEKEANQFDARLSTEPALEKEYAAFLQTRLNPADMIVFPYKNELRKKTVVFAPWLITAISAAAIIMLAWILWPDTRNSQAPVLAKQDQQAVGEEQRLLPSPKGTVGEEQRLLPSSIGSRQAITNNLLTSNQHSSSSKTTGSKVNQQPAEAVTAVRGTMQMNKLSRITPLNGPRIPDPQSVKVMLASNYPAVLTQPLTSAEALTLPQYALQLFREKVLGEDRKLVRRTRFSMWEVAGAGVDKLNSLAGTKMKLNREYDDKGDLLAVSFNSRLIDVETPVRSQEGR